MDIDQSDRHDAVAFREDLDECLMPFFKLGHKPYRS